MPKLKLIPTGAFERYNRKKIERALTISKNKTNFAIDLIPFLIETNHEGLPGYQENRSMPTGIFDYSRGINLEALLEEYFPKYLSLDIKEKPSRSGETEPASIDSLFIMGSIGSIGQNENSDFDYWVCLRPDNLSDDRVTLIKEKLTDIEKWSDEHGIEVHFFIADPEKIRADDFGGSTKESVGSSLGKILKEEFYRTMILVSGKKPLWWVMPPDLSDEEYMELKERIEETLDPEPGLFVDFGNISKITYDEYFGAALWQLNKAMESPYKSALKMALLESYLDTGISGELLCEQLKRSVISSGSNSAAIDSYQIMINRILEYYASLGMKNTVNLMRRCFYIKTKEADSSGASSEKNRYSKLVLNEYIKKWEWTEEFTQSHNNYRRWGFREVLSLGQELHDYMITTYKRLSDCAKTKPNLKRKITDSDLTVLGRKLFSFYSVKPKKINFLKQPFGAGSPLENITFHVAPDKKSGKPVWSVFRGQVPKHKLVSSRERLLKRGFELPQIVMWMLINGISDVSTNYYLIPNPLPISLEEIQKFVKELYNFFPRITISGISNENLFKKPKPQKLFVIVNLMSQPWSRKIEQIELLYSTSWGEYYCETYDEKRGIATMIKYVRELPKLVMSYEGNTYKVMMPRGETKTQTQKRLNTLILKNM